MIPYVPKAICISCILHRNGKVYLPIFVFDTPQLAAGKFI